VHVVHDTDEGLGQRRLLGPQLLPLALELADFRLAVAEILTELLALLLGGLEYALDPLAVVEKRGDQAPDQILALLDPPVDALPARSSSSLGRRMRHAASFASSVLRWRPSRRAARL